MAEGRVSRGRSVWWVREGGRAAAFLHLDMDAFFASVEERDNPQLKGRPVVVGGSALGRRGVVTSANYIARRYGIKAGMPLGEAARLCPRAVFLPVNPPKYTYLSAQIMEALESITPDVVPLSVDEASLQVSGVLHLYPNGVALCQQVKDLIRGRFNLPCTVGMATNPLVAKIAADVAKPDGLLVIAPGSEAEFLAPLEVDKMTGIGPATAEHLRRLGIRRLGDLAAYPAALLRLHFGKNGPLMARAARGEWVGGDAVIRRESPHRSPEMLFGASGVYLAPEEKSIGHERTFSEDVRDELCLRAWIVLLAEMVSRRARRAGKVGKVVVLKLRYTDFTTLHHQATLEEPTQDEEVLFQTGWRLLDEVWERGRPVRLLGLSIHHLSDDGEFSSRWLLFQRVRPNLPALYRAADLLRDRYGEQVIGRAMGRLFLRTFS